MLQDAETHPKISITASNFYSHYFLHRATVL